VRYIVGQPVTERAYNIIESIKTKNAHKDTIINLVAIMGKGKYFSNILISSVMFAIYEGIIS